jgi:hypothetical protein
MKRKKLVNLLFEEDQKEEKGQSKSEFREIVKKAFPLKNVDIEKAKALIQIKDADSSDSVKVSESSKKVGTCKSLKPSQSSMNLGKAVHFALGMLNGTMYGSGGPGGDLGAFTCGGYLLDGHHRWVATCMVSPESEVRGYEISGIDPKDAVKVLNVATAAFMGHNKGKPGDGSFAVFSDSAKILEKLKTADKSSKAVPGESGEGKATSVCEKWASEEGNGEKGDDALSWAANKMADNCKSCDGVNDGAVLIQGSNRVDMPVADDPEHAQEISGDIEPGFEQKGKATQNLIKVLNKGGLDVRESIDLQRWNKLAGLIKG